MSVAMRSSPQFTARTLTAIHLNSIPLRADKRIANQYIMVLRDNTVDPAWRDKSGHHKKELSPEWQPVLSDRRFLAISHPAPLRQSGRACLDSPARAASFTLETLDCWLLLRMSYAFQLMSVQRTLRTFYLAKLVSEGLVVERKEPGSHISYSINQTEEQAIRKILTEMKRPPR